MSGSFVGKNPCDLKKESPSGVFKSKSLSSNAECLARETSDEQVEVGKLSWVDLACVSEVSVFGEVVLVDADGVLVDFGETNTLSTDCAIDTEFKSADSAEH